MGTAITYVKGIIAQEARSSAHAGTANRPVINQYLQERQRILETTTGPVRSLVF